MRIELQEIYEQSVHRDEAGMWQAESQHPDPIICPLVKDCIDIKNIRSFRLPISNSEEQKNILHLPFFSNAISRTHEFLAALHINKHSFCRSFHLSIAILY